MKSFIRTVLKAAIFIPAAVLVFIVFDLACYVRALTGNVMGASHPGTTQHASSMCITDTLFSSWKPTV